MRTVQVVLVAAVLASACSRDAAPPPIDKGDAIFAPVERVRAEYRDNEVRAERAYKGKVIQLRGTVVSVRKSPGPAIILSAGDVEVVATFDTMDAVDENDLALLRRGLDVLVFCLNTGASNGVPLFTRCRLGN